MSAQGAAPPASPVRVFADSNVLIEGLFAPWSASRTILVLSRAGVLRLVLSRYVEEEVERALLKRFAKDEHEGSRLIDDYALALDLLQPERLSRITKGSLSSTGRRSGTSTTCRYSSPRSKRLPTSW